MTSFARLLPFALVLGTTTAQASLQTVTENPLVLSDNVTGLMWAQDANLARANKFGVSGITNDGRMDWATAKTWVTAMNAANYGGYSDWRLPTVSPQNGSSFNYSSWYNGSSDYGYNVSGQASELGYMYYQNLGAKGYYNTSGNTQSGYGAQGVGTHDGTGYDFGAVENVESYAYWSGTAYELNSGGAGASIPPTASRATTARTASSMRGRFAPEEMSPLLK